MTPDDFLRGLGNGADILFQELDLINRRGLLVKLDEAGYRRASFLDHRAFTRETLGVWLPLERILQQAGQIPQPPAPHAIFHVSHCGSTLVSRLLAELPGVMPVREPLVLLGLALEQRELPYPEARLDEPRWKSLFDTALKLFSRTYRPDDRVMLKTTSICGNLVGPFLEPRPESRALLMHINLEDWLAVMLRNENVRPNGRAYAPAWLMDLRRLTGREDLRLAALTEAEQFAANWLAAMLSFEHAGQRFPAQVQRRDFDTLLADPAKALDVLGRFFGLDTGRIAEVAAGPLMKNYAKQPGQAFDTAARARELQEARGRVAAEISEGMRFAERLSREVPAVAPVSAYFTRSSVTKE